MAGELAIVEPLKLPTTVEDAVAQWRDYQTLTQKLLDDTDYQGIGDQRFKKKSAWRKYARAFNISTEVRNEEIVRADDGFPLFAKYVIRAIAPNGRFEEANQECHVTERCGEKCDDDCNGRKHWAHPGDLPATALTRAKNRAISDLIGAGEVSAEEMKTEMAAIKHGEKTGWHPPDKKVAPDNPTTGKIEHIERKSGTKANGAPWTRYGIKVGGVMFGTFDKNIAEFADRMRLQQKTVALTWTAQGDFKTVDTIIEIAEDDNIPDYPYPDYEPGSLG